MVERYTDSQLELFKDAGAAAESGNHSRPSFFSYFRTYDKVILSIIGVVIISAISFSLGVEKGKMISEAKKNQRLDFAKKAEVKVSQVTTPPVNVQDRRAPVTEMPKEAQIPGLTSDKGYFIQLASYKTKQTAQQEADALKKKGMSPLIRAKGSYTVLYVGGFTNRETAQSSLSQLKKRYKDCYIRRL